MLCRISQLVKISSIPPDYNIVWAWATKKKMDDHFSITHLTGIFPLDQLEVLHRSGFDVILGQFCTLSQAKVDMLQAFKCCRVIT